MSDFLWCPAPTSHDGELWWQYRDRTGNFELNPVSRSSVTCPELDGFSPIESHALESGMQNIINNQYQESIRRPYFLVSSLDVDFNQSIQEIKGKIRQLINEHPLVAQIPNEDKRSLLNELNSANSNHELRAVFDELVELMKPNDSWSIQRLKDYLSICLNLRQDRLTSQLQNDYRAKINNLSAFEQFEEIFSELARDVLTTRLQYNLGPNEQTTIISP